MDSSAIVKRYSREAGTAVVRDLYRSAYTGRHTLCTSEWNVGEVLGVLQRKARESGRPRGFTRQRGRLHGEIATLSRLQALDVAAVSSRLLRDSWPILERHLLYVADALQIATARAQACDCLITADRDLREAGMAEGLRSLHVTHDQRAVEQLL